MVQESSANQNMSIALNKRNRSVSSADLAASQGPAPKHHHTEDVEENDHLIKPILQHQGESKHHYFSRLRNHFSSTAFKGRLSARHTFDKDGIYIYKRPVRSTSDTATLLAEAGSVLNHVVVYLNVKGAIKALEFGPRDNGIDITQNFLQEAPAGNVLKHEPEMPEEQHLPMLHIDVDHHHLHTETVTKALSFAESKNYQALRNNCIAFADFIVRVLTGGAVKSAPLLFDAIVGDVPPQDSPALSLLPVMAPGMTWFHVVDGGRLMKEYLETHGVSAIVPPLSGRIKTTTTDTVSVCPMVEKEHKEEGSTEKNDDSAESSDTDECLTPSKIDRQERRVPAASENESNMLMKTTKPLPTTRKKVKAGGLAGKGLPPRPKKC